MPGGAPAPACHPFHPQYQAAKFPTAKPCSAPPPGGLPLCSFHLTAPLIYQALTWYTLVWCGLAALDLRFNFDFVGTAVGERAGGWRVSRGFQ